MQIRNKQFQKKLPIDIIESIIIPNNVSDAFTMIEWV